MVMRSLTMAVTQGYWQTLLEALYSGLEQRDTSGYAWAPSDGWTQARGSSEWTAHLECWLDLGGAFTLGHHSYEHEGRMAFALRYQPDNDSISQARMQAAARDACEYLLRADLPDGARVLGITGATFVGPFPSGYVECQIQFTLRVPR